MNEFTIIESHFKRAPRHHSVVMGIGDDAALLSVPVDKEMAISVDTMVEGQHFLPSMPETALAHKILAVSLSDMAAMGATPFAFELSLTLPRYDESWLHGFAKQLAVVADKYQVDLIGGDLTRGPLSLTSVVQGYVEAGQALTRSGAQVGDRVYVTGKLGLAAQAAAMLQMDCDVDMSILNALYFPVPRVEVGKALVGVATACIDVSDGLAQDLQHILNANSLGADLQIAKIPLVDCGLDMAAAWQYALVGGDDYELCFTAPESAAHKIAEIAAKLQVPITEIGYVNRVAGLRCYDARGDVVVMDHLGFQHF